MQHGHTPGPWEMWRRSDAAHAFGVSSESPAARCDVADVTRFEGDTRGEAEANARLIAAAPDLLASCEAILADDENYMSDDSLMYPEFMAEALRRIAAAVAKAKGA